MVRTKQTGKPRASKVNGTPKAAPKDTQPVKSPTQPAELSEADRTKIKSWLDKQDKPFTVATVPPTRKRKRDAGLQLQTDLFEDRLNIQYEVNPRDKWECLRRYKKFTVGSESIAVGQCILVKWDDSDDPKVEPADQWKARVLEVRALDSEHVYIRVAWLNRPEDLGSGRKPYHGKNELIPTNQLDIIDAMAVNGSVDVVHWDERDDDSALMKQDEYFWRQTYDFSNTRQFSRLREICVDKQPQNPDEMILQCGSKECSQWQHVKCIAEAAAKQASKEASDAADKPTPKRRRPSISENSQAVAMSKTDTFTAELFIKGLPSGEEKDNHPSENTEIIITDRTDGEKHAQDVSCLFCGKEIE